MDRILALLVLALVAGPLPLAAQSSSGRGSGSGSGSGSAFAATLTDPAAIGDAAQKAADRLKGEAKSMVLASRMIGREVTGPGGGTIGTLQDLVVVPGGQIVAVLVKPSGGGQPVALPYGVLKVSAASSTAQKLGLSLPLSLQKARGMQAMQALTKAVTGGSGGG